MIFLGDKIKLIQPKYFKYFKCDGQRCGAKCCKAWNIDIDKNTYKKYAQIESDEKEITSKIKYNEEKKYRGGWYSLTKTRIAHFLRKKICAIYRKNTAKIFYRSRVKYILVT